MALWKDIIRDGLSDAEGLSMLADTSCVMDAALDHRHTQDYGRAIAWLWTTRGEAKAEVAAEEPLGFEDLGPMPEADGDEAKPIWPSPIDAVIGASLFDGPPPEPPKFIVDGILPLDVTAVAGAPGISKSTVEVCQAIHIVLGLPLYGQEVLKPGPVLFINGEDDLSIFRYRLYH